MKKYLLLGLAILLLGVLSARVWLTLPAEECEQLKGLSAQKISATELRRWISPDSDAIAEIKDDIFYIQEAIGSEGLEMIAPLALKGDFILKFDLMSLTKEAVIRLNMAKEDANDIYVMELQTGDLRNFLRIRKNGQLVKQSEIALMKPDVFYPVELEHIGSNVLFSFNGQEILALTHENTAGQSRITFEISGAPDNPAAFEIKELKLFQSK